MNFRPAKLFISFAFWPSAYAESVLAALCLFSESRFPSGFGKSRRPTVRPFFRRSFRVILRQTPKHVQGVRGPNALIYQFFQHIGASVTDLSTGVPSQELSRMSERRFGPGVCVDTCGMHGDAVV